MSQLMSVTGRHATAPPIGETSGVRFLSAGPRALLVELDDLDGMRALAAEVSRRRSDGWAPSLLDVIPGARTVLLDGLDDIPSAIADLRSWRLDVDALGASAPVDVGETTAQIACRYDGPDLAGVAAGWGVTEAQAIEIHTSTPFVVAFCGFAPGFAYLAGLGSGRAVARRASPRATVPAGSVALAGEFTGIYPRPSPGGWQIIASTDVVLWDAGRDPPALLSPGDHVRFRDVEAR
jgi:KipI family sensor histidine kinase inhibitor